METNIFMPHIHAIQSMAKCVRRHVLMSDYSSWRVGGRAAVLVDISSECEIKDVLSYCREQQLNHLVIGRGTNLLFDDAGIDGVVLRLADGFAKTSVVEKNITAEAGAYVPCLARTAATHSLAGLEHLVGIPGSVGGLVVMNGGSQRKAVRDSILRVHVLGQNGDEYSLGREECGFKYRESLFQVDRSVIVRVDFVLQSCESSRVRREMLSILRDRRQKFPLKQPSCGSVFTSDPRLYEMAGSPGKVIDELGLKGMREGDAEVSLLHGNFIVNRGNATSQDIISLIGILRQIVQKKTGVFLKTEVKRVLPDCQIIGI